jgi:hypothetical protein
VLILSPPQLGTGPCRRRDSLSIWRVLAAYSGRLLILLSSGSKRVPLLRIYWCALRPAHSISSACMAIPGLFLLVFGSRMAWRTEANILAKVDYWISLADPMDSAGFFPVQRYILSYGVVLYHSLSKNHGKTAPASSSPRIDSRETIPEKPLESLY